MKSIKNQKDSKKVSSNNAKKDLQKKLQKEQNEVLEATSNISESDLLDKLNAINTIDIKVKEKKNKDKRSNTDFYKYQFLFNKYFEMDFNSIDKDTFKIKGQRLRTKLRNKRNAFSNNIILYKNQSNIELLQKEVKEFISFYLETYVLNDYSLISLSSNNRDKDSEILLKSMLEIVKLMK